MRRMTWYWDGVWCRVSRQRSITRQTARVLVYWTRDVAHSTRVRNSSQLL